MQMTWKHETLMPMCRAVSFVARNFCCPREREIRTYVLQFEWSKVCEYDALTELKDLDD